MQVTSDLGIYLFYKTRLICCCRVANLMSWENKRTEKEGRNRVMMIWKI